MSQGWPVDVFKWVEKTSQFSKGFIENYHRIVMKAFFLEANGQYPKELHEFQNDLSFLPWKIKKLEIGKKNNLLADLYN